MTASELLSACEAFEPDRRGDNEASLSEFARIVDSGRQVLGQTQAELSDQFQVAESTVSRWAGGVVKPHPQIQRLVVKWIGSRARRMASPSPRRTRSATVAPPSRARAKREVAVG